MVTLTSALRPLASPLRRLVGHAGTQRLTPGRRCSLTACSSRYVLSQSEYPTPGHHVRPHSCSSYPERGCFNVLYSTRTCFWYWFWPGSGGPQRPHIAGQHRSSLWSLLLLSSIKRACRAGFKTRTGSAGSGSVLTAGSRLESWSSEVQVYPPPPTCCPFVLGGHVKPFDLHPGHMHGVSSSISGWSQSHLTREAADTQDKY